MTVEFGETVQSIGAAPLSGAAFTGAVTAPTLGVTGTTGAPLPGQLVGGTTTGAPTTGTYVVGDYVIDRQGRQWVCTIAGTPGTWKCVDVDSALRTWHAALGNRPYAPAKIVAFGSSTVEGSGATVYGRQLYNQAVERLRTAFPVTGAVGSVGLIPSVTYSWTSTYPAVMSGGAGVEYSVIGWLQRTAGLTAAGHTVTFTLPVCTGFDIVYAAYSAAGVWSYSVDGGAPVSVNGYQATIDRFKKIPIVPVTRSAHTVTITWVSGSCQIRGMTVYDGDEAAGIQMHEGGHGGWTSTQLLGNADQWRYGITTIQPHLVVFDIGRNDYTAATQIPPATTIANIQSMITTVRANCSTDPSILIYLTQRVSPAGGGGYTWEDYRAAYLAMVAADPGISLFDLSLYQEDPLVDNSLGLYTSVHLTDKGHSATADLMVAHLRPKA